MKKSIKIIMCLMMIVVVAGCSSSDVELPDYSSITLNKNFKGNKEASKNQALAKVISDSKIKKYDQKLIDASVKRQNKVYQNMADAQGMEVDVYLSEVLKIERSKLDKQIKSQAKKEAKAQMVLNEIYDKEDLQPTSKKKNDILYDYATSRGYSLEEFKKEMTKKEQDMYVKNVVVKNYLYKNVKYK